MATGCDAPQVKPVSAFSGSPESLLTLNALGYHWENLRPFPWERREFEKPLDSFDSEVWWKETPNLKRSTKTP